ncbi:unnamed protein product [Cuscuta campestris]|uniref:Uncharacterized protein n=1 Tax=Cuscuta campestris TaxID=132261 RepID=A0A484KM60_9ASTE|nr:unnamed protein product [Cuscuta campestris]VFQ71985.1 unnamed protein product [Cuscuta campestris]
MRIVAVLTGKKKYLICSPSNLHPCLHFQVYRIHITEYIFFWNVCRIKSSLNRLTSQVKSYSIDFLVIEPIVAPNKLDSYMFKLGFTDSWDVFYNKVWIFYNNARLFL